MTITSFDEKFRHAVADIYDAEHQFLDAQQKMLKNANAEELKTLLRDHSEQSKGHIAKLEKVFEMLGETPRRVRCESSRGITAEGEKEMENAGTPAIMDWVIAGAQAKIEHYEIASYRGLIIGAKILDNPEIVALLEQNLQQEEQTADKVQADDGTPRELEEVMAERVADAEVSPSDN